MRKLMLLALMLLSSVLTTALFAQGTMPGAIPARSKGPTDAPVTLEVFNDYACSACAHFNEDTLRVLAIKYPTEMQIIYRHLPLKFEGHENARLASQAVEAAGLQDKFWEMADMILRNQEKWQAEKSALDAFIKYAKEFKLDVDKFKEDIGGEMVRQRINSDIERAVSLKISSTPSVILNGKLLSSADFWQRENLEELIKENIKSKSSK